MGNRNWKMGIRKKVDKGSLELTFLRQLDFQGICCLADKSFFFGSNLISSGLFPLKSQWLYNHYTENVLLALTGEDGIC